MAVLQGARQLAPDIRAFVFLLARKRAVEAPGGSVSRLSTIRTLESEVRSVAVGDQDPLHKSPRLPMMRSNLSVRILSRPFVDFDLPQSSAPLLHRFCAAFAPHSDRIRIACAPHLHRFCAPFARFCTASAPLTDRSRSALAHLHHFSTASAKLSTASAQLLHRPVPLLPCFWTAFAAHHSCARQTRKALPHRRPPC